MNDLIRREDAFKAILVETIYDNVDDVEINCGYSVLDSEGWLGGIRDALRAVESISAAEPERKKGRWIPVESQTVNGRCSVCGYESHLYENDVYGEHYCPHCGADMRGE